MPVFELIQDLPIFPAVSHAREDGLLAVGGDLSETRLVEAYRNGIFPWYEEGQPILWWSPDPRLVLYPEYLKVSRSLRKTLRKEIYTSRINSAFDRVVDACAETRLSRGDGTWITEDMKKAYGRLQRKGFAMSFESWADGELVGGLYGVKIGKCFFGESMFSKRNDASKCALVSLVRYAEKNGIRLIDCQMRTEHLIRMGAHEIPRKVYLQQLKRLVPRYTQKRDRYEYNSRPALAS